MNEALCLDANIFVAALLAQEPSHDEAARLFKALDYHQCVLMEPALVLFEVSTVLQRKVFEKKLHRQATQELADSFFKLPMLLQWQPKLLKDALSLASDFGVKRTNDLSYLAVARKNKIPLITLDQQLLQMGRKVFPHVYTPEEFLQQVA